ncbi:hypothetical protein BDN72DRAFT_175756 [Pluteus cervinus]|uniref:Uncharacterized protein n=1 Tax=Pluteus cervinus TaxID=181527 RepID=A0ACD3AJ19_9AGAR|nr:hypothetical protein BDN72DRAFT_175756 [Pluteus cervinus]
MSDGLKLILTPDNPCNTLITDSETGEKIYHVITEHTKDETTTKLKDAVGKQIASWRWRESSADVLTVGESKPQSSSGWLKKTLIPFKATVTFQSANGKEYKWKGNEPGGALQLFDKQNKETPIASFTKSRKYRNRQTDPPTEEFRDASITLDSRGLEIQNEVVLSFLLLERKRRTDETATVSRAEALAIAPGEGLALA